MWLIGFDSGRVTPSSEGGKLMKRIERLVRLLRRPEVQELIRDVVTVIAERIAKKKVQE